MKLKSPANVITASRIVLSAAVLFLPALSTEFFAVYSLCGLSDIADGFIARKTGTESELGAKLDSVADTAFVAACLIKLLPKYRLNAPLWIWIGAIAVLQLANIIRAEKFELLHTNSNKITGLMLFALPFAAAFCDVKYAAIPVCAMASFAAVQEFLKNIKS